MKQAITEEMIAEFEKTWKMYRNLLGKKVRVVFKDGRVIEDILTSMCIEDYFDEDERSISLMDSGGYVIDAIESVEEIK